MYTDQKSYDGKVFLLDVTSPEFIENPYRFYRERQDISKVIQVQENVWSISDFDLVSDILRNSSFGREGGLYSASSPEIQQYRKANLLPTC